MKIGIVGAGAVGGYFGGLLAKSCADVHFLVNTDFAHVRDNGLRIDSKNGNFVLDPVNLYSHAKGMPVCDVVIIALKTTHNHLLPSILPTIIKKSGTVVSLQNGYNIEKDISAMVPDATIIGGLCFLCSLKAGPGHIRHLDYGSIRLGQYQKDQPAAGITREVQIVADMFTQAAIPVHLAENLAQARWEKLVWNMGFSGLSVVLNSTTAEIMKHPSSRDIAFEIMKEVIQGARISGFDIDDQFAERMLKTTQQMADFSPSMKFDYEAGRSMEIDAIYWRPIQEASNNGFDMQKSKLIAGQLDFLDSKIS